jgi:HK97 family phage major capsid protein
MKNLIKFVFHVLFAAFAVQSYVVAVEKSTDQQILESLTSLTQRMGKIEEIEKSIGKNREDYDMIGKLVAEVQKENIELRKMLLSQRNFVQRRPGEISEDCARYLGAIAMIAGIKQERFSGKTLDFAQAEIKNILGVEAKAALTTSEIPLPTQWGKDVVELVSLYGAARKYGTVMPLGAGTVKLPKLGTSPAFGLIASSASVPEKAPAIAFVTFTAEKYGGLVRLPSEIDEDSVVGLGQFLGRYCAREMAKSEDTLFWTGDGSTNGDPEGLILNCATDSKTVTMAATKNKRSDTTLANLRAMRAVVDAAALGTSAYYFHPSFEQHFSGLNTAGDKPYLANGINGASLDGFPIRWVDVLPVYSTTDTSGLGFGLFGDASYQYLGVRKAMEMKTSAEAGFTTDEILVRALERYTIGKMAAGAMCVLVAGADS